MNVEKKYIKDAQNEDGLEIDIFKSIETGVVGYRNKYGIVIPLEGTGTPDFTDVYNNLSANNSTANTTAILKYGINIFTVATQNNFAAKLPQPTTGRTTIIVNNTTSSISLYPSNVGGKINNYPINTPAIIPPDGKSYSFICVENPLPGEWVWSSPAIGQYDSGNISIALTSGTGFSGQNPKISAYDNIVKNILTGFTTSNVGFNGKNKGLVIGAPTSPDGIYFKPAGPWSGIAKIKIYTNATATSLFSLYGNGELDQYDILTGAVIQNGPSVGSAFAFNVETSNVIAGTPLDAGYIQPFIGAPGTSWAEYIFPNSIMPSNNASYLNSSIIGDQDMGNALFTGTFPSEYVGELVNNYYSAYLTFQMQPMWNVNYGTKTFQFKFIIEYY